MYTVVLTEYSSKQNSVTRSKGFVQYLKIRGQKLN